jgi:hypothetical protein
VLLHLPVVLPPTIEWAQAAAVAAWQRSWCCEPQRQTTASTTTSPPRPPQCETCSPWPSNTRRPFPTSTTYSSSSSHVLQARTGRSFGPEARFSARIRRQHTPSPWHPYQGLWHDGKHIPVALKARAYLFMAHLKPQSPSLTCGSSGGEDVAGKPASRDATATVLPVLHHHTPRLSTKQHYELLL